MFKRLIKCHCKTFFLNTELYSKTKNPVKPYDKDTY